MTPQFHHCIHKSCHETHFHIHFYYTHFNTGKSWFNIEVMFLKTATQKQCTMQLWEHPHDSTAHLLPLSHNMFSSPSFLTAKLWSTCQIRPQLFLHFTSQQDTLSPSVSFQLALLNATDMGNHSTSHAYQLCQLTNGRPGWTAEDQYKRDQFSKLWTFSRLRTLTQS